MNRLKELRNQRNLTQIEFAKLIGAGQSTIANWENGIRDIDSDRIVMLADFFDVTADYLLGRIDAPTPHNTKKDTAEAVPLMDEKTKDIMNAYQRLSLDRSKEKALEHILLLLQAEKAEPQE